MQTNRQRALELGHRLYEADPCPKCSHTKRYTQNRTCARCIQEATKLFKRARKRELRAWIASYKNRPCMDCGNSYPPYVMEFDHREPSSKSITMAKMPGRIWGNKRVHEEAAKCDIVCANCHRIRTHGRGA